jgi:hypothetical protein
LLKVVFCSFVSSASGVLSWRTLEGEDFFVFSARAFTRASFTRLFLSSTSFFLAALLASKSALRLASASARVALRSSINF